MIALVPANITSNPIKGQMAEALLEPAGRVRDEAQIEIPLRGFIDNHKLVGDLSEARQRRKPIRDEPIGIA